MKDYILLTVPGMDADRFAGQVEGVRARLER